MNRDRFPSVTPIREKGGRNRSWVSVLLCCLSGLLLGVALPAQIPGEECYGKVVHRIFFGPRGVNEKLYRGLLKTQEGKPLRHENVVEELNVLFRDLEVVAHVRGEVLESGEVDVYYDIHTEEVYDRVEFKGNLHITEADARLLLGIPKKTRISLRTAKSKAMVLADRYRRDGYYFVDVRTKTDDEKSIVTFMVDEGELVTVGKLEFRGNVSYPGTVPVGENLRGSAKLELLPGLLFRGQPFSDVAVEDDLQKLRIFYRRNGFLDAQVELEERTWSEDMTVVDLTYRVVEGARYKVVAVDLVQRRSDDKTDDRPPLYPKEEVMRVLKVKAGDPYSRHAIDADMNALRRYYGQRGHPTFRQYGVENAQNILQVPEPIPVYSPDKPELTLTYQLVEGTPKHLRDVKIGGNTYTGDRIIRREVRLFPGDLLDVSKLERSRNLLDRLRYFNDPRTLTGVRMRLLPVKDSDDEVDLDIQVQEGDTGSFVWGAAISSGTGVRGTFKYEKRNFDITRLPSSFNPATIVSEIVNAKAFHGGGQDFSLYLSPGTEISTFQASLDEPDLFQDHIDRIGLRLLGYRTIRIMDSYDTDRLGAAISLRRMFDDQTTVGLTFRQESAEVQNVDDNAPTLVWNARGQTEMRGVELSFVLSDLDHPLIPRVGYNLRVYGEVVGGLLGAEEDFYKVGAMLENFHPIYEDALERKHVFYHRFSLDVGETFGSSDVLFPSERFFMGGSNLRGFKQRQAGPTQFGQPLGGEARFLSTLEYQYPLVSTRMQGTTRETEIVRGVIFADFGLLGLDISDSSFHEPRLSVGFGVRILVPVLQIPIHLDLGWPILSEETDDEQQVFFTLSRF